MLGLSKFSGLMQSKRICNTLAPIFSTSMSSMTTDHHVVKSKKLMLPRSLSTYPQLRLSKRDTTLSGSRKSRKLREDGHIPGVVYGVDDDRNVFKLMITLERKAIMQEIRKFGSSFENIVYEVIVEDPSNPGAEQKHVVTPRQIQINPITELPLSVNFLKYYPGNRLRIPFKFANSDQSQDLRRGTCQLIRVNEFIECVCDEAVPQNIAVDLSEVKKGDVIRLDNLELPPKVRPAKTVPSDFVVAVLKATRGS